MNNKLEAILMKLIRAAEASHQPQQQQLPHGLFVEVTITRQPGAKFTLRIWRLGESPSDTEWRTVLREIPEPYKSPFPLQGYSLLLREGSRHVFSGSWPAPLTLFSILPPEEMEKYGL